MKIAVKNRCCCCGREFESYYKQGDEMSKVMAESCDVCPACFEADCRVLTGEICDVTGKIQAQYKRTWCCENGRRQGHRPEIWQGIF